MKKWKRYFALVSCVMLLSGCQFPFAENGTGGQVKRYIESNNAVLTASSEIDVTTMEPLKDMKRRGVNYENLIETTVLARKMQQDLYDAIRDEEVTRESERLKFVYLQMINSRIQSYNVLIETLREEDVDAVQQFYARHAAKDAQLMVKTKNEINQVLKLTGEKVPEAEKEKEKK